MNKDTSDEKMIIQFDGLCILCSSTVRFILKADKQKKFVFQTLQSATNDKSFDTVIVIDGETKHQFFDAVLKIGNELGGFYKTIIIFRLLPAKWRHQLYLWVARNRFSWFGSRATCYLPSPEEKDRFI
jgi:predicted DCC family thiol-disulfide oxidoreductase YuxK